jgi:hypothetical protein
MLVRLFSIGAGVLLAASAPALADPRDHAKKLWEKRADCDKKLFEAKSRRDFYQKASECNRELAKLTREQRRESAKEWREAEKKWRERNRYYSGGYYDWDD